MEGMPLLRSYNKRNNVQPPSYSAVNRHDLNIQKDIELERVGFQDGVRSRSNEYEVLSDTETETIVKIPYLHKNKVEDTANKTFEATNNMDVDTPKYRLQSKGTETMKSISSVDEFNLTSISLSPTMGLF